MVRSGVGADNCLAPGACLPGAAHSTPWSAQRPVPTLRPSRRPPWIYRRCRRAVRSIIRARCTGEFVIRVQRAGRNVSQACCADGCCRRHRRYCCRRHRRYCCRRRRRYYHRRRGRRNGLGDHRAWHALGAHSIHGRNVPVPDRGCEIGFDVSACGSCQGHRHHHGRGTGAVVDVKTDKIRELRTVHIRRRRSPRQHGTAGASRAGRQQEQGQPPNGAERATSTRKLLKPLCYHLIPVAGRENPRPHVSLSLAQPAAASPAAFN